MARENRYCFELQNDLGVGIGVGVSKLWLDAAANFLIRLCMGERNSVPA